MEKQRWPNSRSCLVVWPIAAAFCSLSNPFVASVRSATVRLTAFFFFLINLPLRRGTAVAQWLRCCATNRKVAGSIPDGVIGIFHGHNLSERTVVLGSTQPLTEMSTRSISWG